MTGPCCYDCLTEDVTVKVTDEHGFDHWFCADDWAAQQEFSRKVSELLRAAVDALSPESPGAASD